MFTVKQKLKPEDTIKIASRFIFNTLYWRARKGTDQVNLNIGNAQTTHPFSPWL